MKKMRYLPLALVLTIPSLALAEYEGEVNLGVRTTHYASDEKSAKFEEYTDEHNGLFGSAWVLLNEEEYSVRASLDKYGAEISGRQYGLWKGRLYYDSFTHHLYNDALLPVDNIGSDVVVIPELADVPPVSEWMEFDYKIDRKFIGGEVTVDTESPFYYKFGYEQQQNDGIMPYGTIIFSDFEVPMPIDYTTNILSAESGYRSKETTVVLGVGYSDFDNDNDLLTVTNGVETEEYSMPADNYSWNISGRLRQQLPMNSLLAMKASYTQNKSSPDFDGYTTLPSPTDDGDYDGDVKYIRVGAAVTTRFNNDMDTRLYYDYVDRDNDSDEITAVNDDSPDELVDNELFEYTKNQAGLDFNYRFDRANKLESGYQFTNMDRSREDADSSDDNLLFAQLKNTSLDWMTTKFRLEYLNRDTDSDYSEEHLAGDGLIHEFFTPWDVASKDRYKTKLSLEFYPVERLDLGLSYAFVYDDYDATQLGVQADRRHEVYANAGYQLKSKIKFNTYLGYEYTDSDFDSRRYNSVDQPTPGNPNPNSPTTSNDYNWNQETTYDFFAIGGSVTVPVLHNLDMVMNADYQVVDGNIDFSRPASVGDPLESIDNADDYYKTQLGVKAIYEATQAISCTVGYRYEKSNLKDWKFDNYTFTPGSDYLSGAGLDNQYETHQFYVIGTYRF